MRSSSRSSPRRQTDQGFTLIELIVYVSLFVLILTIVIGFLASSTQTESTIRKTSDAATSGQLLVESVQHGVRNSQALRLQPDTVAGAEMLVAWTANSGGDTATWSCQAWYYTPDSGGSVYTKRTALLPIAEPTNAEALSGWILLGEDLSRVNDGPIFVLSSAQTVDITFAIDSGGAPPVVITSAASSPVAVVGSTPCSA